MQTLAALRDQHNPMEPDRARAIAHVASVLVDSAKAEVDYLRTVGTDQSQFFEAPALRLASNATEVTAHNPFPVVARNRA